MQIVIAVIACIGLTIIFVAWTVKKELEHRKEWRKNG